VKGARAISKSSFLAETGGRLPRENDRMNLSHHESRTFLMNLENRNGFPELEPVEAEKSFVGDGGQ
jgi:hypothetical protein